MVTEKSPGQIPERPPGQPTRRKEPVYFAQAAYYSENLLNPGSKMTELYRRLSSDQELRARALRDGAAVLREFGLDIPENVTVEFHEYDERHHHMILPPANFEFVPVDVDERYRYRFESGAV